MSQTEDGLTLDAVVRRFADSEQALGEVQDKLQALASAGVSAEASAASLRETADSVRGFVEIASEVTGELRGVTAQARAVLESGAAVLDGSALRAIEGRLEDLGRALQESQVGLDQRVSRLDRGAELIFRTLPGRWRKEEYPQE
jgi:hypothetical protein